ncbi:MAG: helix-turn-helix domain-containing protein [Methylobacter sp.]
MAAKSKKSGSIETDKKQRAAILRSLGMSTQAIANQLGTSVRSVQRWLEGLDITKSDADLAKEVRKQLVADLLESDAVRGRIAAQVADDLALSQRMRDKLTATLSFIEPTDLRSAGIAARALAACSTTLKNLSDTARHQLLHREEVGSDELPVLTIEKLTDAEVQALRTQQAQECGEFDVSDDETIDGGSEAIV